MAHVKPVLLVVDDPKDGLLLKRVFQEIQIENPPLLFTEVSQAIQYLAAGSGAPAAKHPAPALVLVSWQASRHAGHELLRWFYKHPELKAQVPVIVHTWDVLPGTARLVTKLGADGLMLWPLTYEALRDQIQELKARWL